MNSLEARLERLARIFEKEYHHLLEHPLRRDEAEERLKLSLLTPVLIAILEATHESSPL